MNKNTIITKEFLQEKGACKPSLEWAIENGHLNNTLEMSIEILLEEKRYSDLNWLITRCLNTKQNVALAIFAAESVLHLFESEFPNDDRPRKAIDAAKNNNATNAAAYATANATKAANAAKAANANAYAAANAAAAAAYATTNATAADNAAYTAAKAATDAATDHSFRKKLAEYVLTSIMD